MHLSEEERYLLHQQSMEYLVYAHCLNGLVLTIGENYDCVALWLPPGKNIDDWWTILRSGMWRLGWSLSKEGYERLFKEFFPLLSRSKHEVLGEIEANSWYLNYIGTRASARGKGYAKKLITHVTDQVCVSLEVEGVA
jgi:GNAT superfamily N-acetyltransferase